MHILNAVLAFALTMLVLSTVSAALVEILHNFIKQRRRFLKEMIGALFDNVIWPKFEHLLVPEDITDQATRAARKRTYRDDFITHLTLDRGAPEYQNTRGLTVSPTVENLSSIDFATRLAETEIGKVIWHEAKGAKAAVLDPILEELVRKFDAVGQDASDFFRRDSRLLSVIAGIIIAFLVNVDAGRIFAGFIRDPALTEAVVKRADAIVARAEQEMAAARAAASNADQKNPPPQTLLEETKKQAEELNKKIGELSEMGLPIGTAYFPWCAGASDIDPNCVAVREKRKVDCKPGCPKETPGVEQVLLNIKAAPSAALQWVLITFGTGLLIGLGGPFWFDRIRDLMRIRELFSAFASVLPQRKAPANEEKKAEPQAPATAPTVPPPKDPIDAFKKARTAADLIASIATPPSSALELNADGTLKEDAPR